MANPNPSSVDSQDSVSSEAGDTPDLAASPHTLKVMQKETLFQECRFVKELIVYYGSPVLSVLASGSLLLHATSVDDSPLSPILSALCERSETLYDVCVACQAYLTYGADSTFYEFYSEALSKFRTYIDHPLRTTDEALINAALLLCTIGILQGTPWTIHIHGVERLLDERAALSPLDNVEPAFISAIEVMGVMDIDVFCVGRQSPSLKAWRRHREGQFVRYEEEPDTVQSMAGLPRSLLDLLAIANDELTQEQIWLWPGCEGTYLQCQLWEAYRFSVMLFIEERDSLRSPTSFHHSPTGVIIKLPSHNLILTRALSAIDAVYNGQSKPDAANSLVLNAMYFPLFQVSVEVLSSEDQDGRHALVEKWFDKLIEKDVFENTKQAWTIAQAIGRKRREGFQCTPDEVARSMGIELGLF